MHAPMDVVGRQERRGDVSSPRLVSCRSCRACRVVSTGLHTAPAVVAFSLPHAHTHTHTYTYIDNKQAAAAAALHSHPHCLPACTPARLPPSLLLASPAPCVHTDPVTVAVAPWREGRANVPRYRLAAPSS